MKEPPKDPKQPELEKASGSVENPIPPGEPQPGDENEMASNLGGPVDVFPGRVRKPAQQQE